MAQLTQRVRQALLLLGLALTLQSAPAQAAVPTPAPAPGRSAGAGAGASGAVAPTAVPAPSAARGTIVGGVLLDEDLSGTPSRGDRPLVGITVRIAGPGVATGIATAADGSFAFGGLAAGTYTVSIGLPAGVVALSGTSRTVTLDGSGAGRVDFFVGRPERVPLAAAQPPTPTPTPQPALPTSTPRPLPTPVPAPGYTQPSGSAGSRAPSSGGQATSGFRSAPYPPIAASSGPRYAPGRGNPAAIQPVRTERAFWLGVPFISQLDGSAYSEVNCGPASTAMILRAFGIRTTPAAVRNYVNDMSGVYSQAAGTSLDHLGRVLRESGLEVSYLYDGARYRAWSVELLREQVLAGHPVMTLVKYRALPGHSGSYSDFDHYIVISGVAGDDFIYNDAAYSSDRGYGLLISPGDLQRAWDYSSIPRHGLAVSLPAAASEPAGTDPAGPGPDLSDEELLAASDLSLGEEIQLRDAFGDLLFQRHAFDAQPASSSAPEPQAGLELAEFVPLEIAGGAAPGASDDAPGAAPPELIHPPALPEYLPLLAALAAGLLLALGLVKGRRVLDS